MFKGFIVLGRGLPPTTRFGVRVTRLRPMCLPLGIGLPLAGAVCLLHRQVNTDALIGVRWPPRK